jgi:hypothetical protein
MVGAGGGGIGEFVGDFGSRGQARGRRGKCGGRSLMSGARLSNFYVARVPAPPDGPLWVGSSTVLLDKVLGAACCWQRLGALGVSPFWPSRSKSLFGGYSGHRWRCSKIIQERI